MSHIVRSQIPNVTDPEAIGIRNFSGINNLIELVQFPVESGEIEVLVLRVEERGDDITFVFIAQKLTETQRLHSLAENGPVFLISGSPTLHTSFGRPKLYSLTEPENGVRRWREPELTRLLQPQILFHDVQTEGTAVAFTRDLV